MMNTLTGIASNDSVDRISKHNLLIQNLISALIALPLVITALPLSAFAEVVIVRPFYPPRSIVRPPAVRVGRPSISRTVWVPGHWSYTGYGRYWVPGRYVRF